MAESAREGRRALRAGPGDALGGRGEPRRLIRGIDPAREDTVADIGAHMRSGALDDLKPGEFGIVLGGELARALGVRIRAIRSSSSRRRAR